MYLSFFLFVCLSFLLLFPNVLSPATSASPEDRPSSGGDRKKWEAGVPLVLSVAQQTLEQTCFRTIGEFPYSWVTTRKNHKNLHMPHKNIAFLCVCVCVMSQSKRWVKSYRWVGYRRKLRGRCGEPVQTLRCWESFRRQSCSRSPSSWRTSPCVRKSFPALVSSIMSLCGHEGPLFYLF